MWLCSQLGFPFSSFIKCITIYALFPSYYCTKYIDNHSNTASGIPAYLGLFVSCLSDRLVDIVSDLPLLSLQCQSPSSDNRGLAWFSGKKILTILENKNLGGNPPK